MSSLSHLQDLMARVGPAGDLLSVNEYTAERLWHIGVEDGIEIFAELDEDRDVLVLSADLGAPGRSDPQALFELCLRTTFAWLATGGLRIGLDRTSGSLTLLCDFGAASLTLDDLVYALKSFGSRSVAWRDLVARREGEAALPPDSLSDYTILRL